MKTRYPCDKLTNNHTMTLRFPRLLTLLAVSLLAFACGGEEAQRNQNMKDNAAKGTGSMAEAADAADVPMDAVLKSGDVTLTPMPATHDFPDATLNEWTYKNGTFSYDVTNYEFAAQTPDADALMCANSGKGQHAHLIINNEPYIAKYEPTFSMDLPDGTHHILTFLSRSYHESIKNGTAYRAVTASVENNSFTDAVDIKTPMLFYSRPKGTYAGKKATENVMLDFYPVNAELSADGFYVEASVNGGPAMKITEWQPYYLKGLPMGENTVKLSLMKDGELVDTPLNPVSRTFTLEALPAE